MTTQNKWGDVSQYDDNKNPQSIQLLKLDEIKMDSRNGKWFRKFLTKAKITDPKTGKEVYAKEELPDQNLEIIIIRGNRRKLVKTGQAGKKLEETREYTDNTKATELYNYDTKVRQIVIPKNIGQNGYKSHNYIYALYKGELVKVVLKGGQVKTSDKIKGLTDYFSYLFSFKENEKPYMFVTVLEPQLYTIPMGDFYTLNFKKAEPIENDLVIETVKKGIIEVGDNLKQYDSKRFAKDSNTEAMPVTNYDGNEETKIVGDIEFATVGDEDDEEF